MYNHKRYSQNKLFKEKSKVLFWKDLFDWLEILSKEQTKTKKKTFKS